MHTTESLVGKEPDSRFRGPSFKPCLVHHHFSHPITDVKRFWPYPELLLMKIYLNLNLYILINSNSLLGLTINISSTFVHLFLYWKQWIFQSVTFYNIFFHGLCNVYTSIHMLIPRSKQTYHKHSYVYCNITNKKIKVQYFEIILFERLQYQRCNGFRNLENF